MVWESFLFFSFTPGTLSPTTNLKLTPVVLFLTLSMPAHATWHKVLAWSVEELFVILQNKYSVGEKGAK